jgi:hypothetical protein
MNSKRLPVGIRIGKELAMANRRIDQHVAEQGGKRVAVPCLPKREKIDAPELPAELLADIVPASRKRIPSRPAPSAMKVFGRSEAILAGSISNLRGAIRPLRLWSQYA